MRQRVLLQSVVLAASMAVFVEGAFAQRSVQPRMGDPLPGLTPAQLTRFLAGKEVFNAPLQVDSGLGPIFNKSSCGGCHGQPTVGGSSAISVTRFGKAAIDGNPFDPLANLGGSLLQSQAIADPCLENVPDIATVTAHRITPPTFGFGLIESIDDGDISIRETNPPNGVSGKAHMVPAFEDPPNSKLHVGRFGWKAQVATVLTFSADASLNEMGMTNRFLTEENAPNGNLELLAEYDMVADPEDGPDAEGYDKIDRQTDFQRFLAAPPQTPRSGMRGEVLFKSVGCAACHVTDSYTTKVVGETALTSKSIKPYSDFLLHDMGSLGDGIVQGDAKEQDFRTPPLWGLRARGSLALLHDGRASSGEFSQNIITAVGWHDGEGAAARDNFQALSTADQEKVINFLDSLGRVEFDFEGDNDVDDIDWFFLEPLFVGPTPTYTPDDFPSIADFDQDGDFDLIDFGWMQRAATGPSF